MIDAAANNEKVRLALDSETEGQSQAVEVAVADRIHEAYSQVEGMVTELKSGLRKLVKALA